MLNQILLVILHSKQHPYFTVSCPDYLLLVFDGYIVSLDDFANIYVPLSVA